MRPRFLFDELEVGLGAWHGGWWQVDGDGTRDFRQAGVYKAIVANVFGYTHIARGLMERLGCTTAWAVFFCTVRVKRRTECRVRMTPKAKALLFREAD